MDIVNEMERARLLGTTPPTHEEIYEHIGDLEDEAHEAGSEAREKLEAAEDRLKDIKDTADEMIGCGPDYAETVLQRLLAHCGQDELTASRVSRAFVDAIREAPASKP